MTFPEEPSSVPDDTDASSISGSIPLKKVVSYIAGDMFLPDPVAPDLSEAHVDFQTHAFAQALRHAERTNRRPDREVARLMFMFDQVNNWETYLEPSASRRHKRSPRIGDLLPQFRMTLMSEARRTGLSQEMIDKIEVVPEAKLRQKLTQILGEEMVEKGETQDKLRSLGITAVSEKDEEEVIKCRGIAAALFLRASTLRDGRPVDRVRAFFQVDPKDPKRVDWNVITDGAKFVQTEMGVQAPIRVFMYTPIDAVTPGTFKETICDVHDGEIEEVKF